MTRGQACTSSVPRSDIRKRRTESAGGRRAPLQSATSSSEGPGHGRSQRGLLEAWQYHFYGSEVSHLFPLCPFVPGAQRYSLHWSHNVGRHSLHQAMSVRRLEAIAKTLGMPRDAVLNCIGTPFLLNPQDFFFLVSSLSRIRAAAFHHITERVFCYFRATLR